MCICKTVGVYRILNIGIYMLISRISPLKNFLVYFQGEEYKLFWPERSEFVRMAAQFGTKIIPFGAVGEDDFAQVNSDRGCSILALLFLLYYDTLLLHINFESELSVRIDFL